MDAISEKFLVSIDTYDNTKERFTFFVTSSGGLIDGLNTGDFDEDGLKFNTLFDAKIQKNNNGWSTEIIIPYSALRFPNKKNHSWGINFGRNIKDFEEMYVWSPVDERILKFYQTMVLLKNISDSKILNNKGLILIETDKLINIDKLNLEEIFSKKIGSSYLQCFKKLLNPLK